jgi:hypothetical protein
VDNPNRLDVPSRLDASMPSAVSMPSIDPVPPPRAGRMRPQTVSLAVNLRAAPTTSAPLLTTLPALTEVWLVGERISTDGASWQQVRTDDGREGWIIASVLD